jgi:hypothetical protein
LVGTERAGRTEQDNDCNEASKVLHGSNLYIKRNKLKYRQAWGTPPVGTGKQSERIDGGVS